MSTEYNIGLPKFPTAGETPQLARKARPTNLMTGGRRRLFRTSALTRRASPLPGRAMQVGGSISAGEPPGGPRGSCRCQRAGLLDGRQTRRTGRVK